MARALMLDTPFILADEMLRSFPDHTKKVLWERFYEFTLSGKHPKGLMLITHWNPMLELMPNPKILRIDKQSLTD
jgi:ABC-type lipoprotein export system ATPase subunit